MAGKLGVYICSGCGIGEAIDTAEVAKVATRESKAAVCRTHAALCGAEGCAQIRQDIAGGAVDTVVVAGCSPRFKQECFNFNHGTVVERVNLREHVAWCHTPNDEDTQMLAEDYLRMGVARALKTEPLEHFGRRDLADGAGGGRRRHRHHGGARGRGGRISVVLVEKGPKLGGFAAAVKRHVPTAPPYTTPAADGLQEKSKRSCTIRASGSSAAPRWPRSKASPACSTSRWRRKPGHRRSARAPSSWPPAGSPTMLPASRTSDTASARTSSPTSNWSGWPRRGRSCGLPTASRAASVLFVQCAGSRDKDHLPYCSSVCCMGTLKQVDLHPRAGSGRAGLRHLQGHAHARPVRALLPRGAGPPAELLHQGRGGGGEEDGATGGSR